MKHSYLGTASDILKLSLTAMTTCIQNFSSGKSVGAKHLILNCKIPHLGAVVMRFLSCLTDLAIKREGVHQLAVIFSNSGQKSH